MSTNIKLTQYLKSLSEENKIQEIKKLVTLFPLVKEYYQSKLSNEGEVELLKKYTLIIKKEFNTGNNPGRARISIAKKAVSDFIKVSRSESNVAEIMIQYVENGVRFTNAFGDIDESFYYSMESMFDKALDYIVKNNLKDSFKERCAKIVSDTDGIGWGFPDELEELFLTHMSE